MQQTEYKPTWIETLELLEDIKKINLSGDDALGSSLTRVGHIPHSLEISLERNADLEYKLGGRKSSQDRI